MREKLLKFFIIILILSVVGLGGYVVYDKYFNKEPIPPKTEKKEEKTENLDVTSKEVTSLFNNINKLSHAWTSEDYYGWLFKNDSLKVEDMSDELIVANALYHLYADCLENDLVCVEGSEDEIGTTIIKAPEVKEKVNELFGNIEYKNSNTSSFDCGGKFTYNSDKDNYTAQAPACGYAGNSFATYDYGITKALKKDKELDIYVKVAFKYFDFILETDENDNITQDNMHYIYTDFNRKNKIDEIEDRAYDFNEVLEKHGELLPVYKLHFENENGKYHFKSIEKQ